MEALATPPSPPSPPWTTPHLPPGPRGRILQTIRYMRSPWARTVELFERHGDTMFFPSVNADVVLTRDPEFIRAIYTLDPSQFRVFGADIFAPLVGAGSLLSQDGEPHRRERKLLTPPFHGARMKAYGKLMLDLAGEETERWPLDRTFNLHRALQSVSMRVILRAVFGVADAAEMLRLEELTAKLNAAFNPALIFFPVLQRPFFGLGPFDRFLAVREQLDARLFAQIRDKRLAPLGEDILSLMLSSRYEDGSAMTDQHLRDELVTLLLAGHETTALGLAWLFDFLSRDPALVARLRAEQSALGQDPDPEQIAHLPLLEACCSESLRLRPVVNETFRLLTVPLALGPFRIPAGTVVGASVAGMHQNPRVYPEPQRFRPERFLERKYGPFEYLAFGGGVRRCIGAAMAQYEMKMVAATVLRHCDLVPASPTPPRGVFRGVTMAPEGGIPVRLVARR